MSQGKTSNTPPEPDNQISGFKSLTAAMRYIKTRFKNKLVCSPSGYGELVIKIRGRDETSYFATDPDDAVATARSMFKSTNGTAPI